MMSSIQKPGQATKVAMQCMKHIGTRCGLLVVGSLPVCGAMHRGKMLAQCMLMYALKQALYAESLVEPT